MATGSKTLTPSESTVAPTSGETTENTLTPSESTEEGRTFTQEEFEAALGTRLARERAKFADYDELKADSLKLKELEDANKSELQKALEEAQAAREELEAIKAERERLADVAEVAREAGVDADLLGRMNGDIRENAELLKTALASQPKYTALKDGGENVKTHAAMTKEEIMQISDGEQRLKAITENISLFE